MNTKLNDQEVIIKEGIATQLKGIEAVTGRIYLTNQRLIFESHKFNIQTGFTIVSINNIDSMEKSRPKIFGIIPTLSNALVIKTKDNQVFSFTVLKNTEWIKKLEEVKQDPI